MASHYSVLLYTKPSILGILFDKISTSSYLQIAFFGGFKPFNHNWFYKILLIEGFETQKWRLFVNSLKLKISSKSIPNPYVWSDHKYGAASPAVLTGSVFRMKWSNVSRIYGNIHHTTTTTACIFKLHPRHLKCLDDKNIKMQDVCATHLSQLICIF